jgi:predicted dinucleotide-binding enzyme
MNIGIIGSGHIGSLLAKLFISAGHQVSIANSRSPQFLATLAAETGVLPATVEQVVADKHIVVIAIPEGSILNLPRDLFNRAAAETIVVDTGNYYPEVRDAQIVEIDNGLTESGWVSQRLSIPIVKAFNNITAWSLETRRLPPGTHGRVCLSVAGDNTNDKQVILKLIDQIGFDVLDAGTLADSWRQQPGAPAYCRDLDMAAMTTALKYAEFTNITQYRMNAMSEAKCAVEEAGSLAGAVANSGKPGK